MKFNYITIEREYASGGSEIGKKASELLNIPCYGREILDLTAQRRNVSAEYIEELEENTSGSFLYSLYRMSNLTGSPTASEAVNIDEMNVIRELAGNGPAIFVGRAAAFSLTNVNKVLKVFIHASQEYREVRANETYGVDVDKVKAVIKRYDKRRSSYYKANFGKEWKDYASYDLVLDSSIFGIEKCAEIIAESVK